MNFIVKDWAGNTCFKGKTFKTFEDAWEFIYSQYSEIADLDPPAFDEQMSEYFVENL